MAQVDKIGKWSREKLDLLRAYLAAYTSILNTQRETSSNSKGWLRKVHYIDAFAGSVTPWDKEAQEYIDGSPLVALKVSPAFDKYIFIDKDEKRLVENINPLKGEFKDKTIETLPGDCNDVLIGNILPRFPREDGGVRRELLYFLIHMGCN